jgi:8-oxo-dGTP pyrophosphatase MutT (NUDIX family)
MDPGPDLPAGGARPRDVADALAAARALRAAGRPGEALAALDAFVVGRVVAGERRDGPDEEREACLRALARALVPGPGAGVVGVRVGVVPDAEALAHFAAAARAAGRRLVVGAVVADDRGRVFVQRRNPTRALFPGCWDLVGGHAEPWESVEAALAREVAEETGWRLAGLGRVVEVLDWEGGGERKREVDLLVRVGGDMSAPRLEADKHSEARWLEPPDLPLLLERRDPDDVFVHTVVARAFALLRHGG